MKRLSLQWRITLMSVLLIGITCVAMNLLLCSSGVYYMDTIADSLQGGGTVILNDGGAASFDPQLIAPDEELTIVVDGAQGRFRTTNWYITAAVTLLSGILAIGLAFKTAELYRLIIAGHYTDFDGICIAITQTPLRKYRNIRIIDSQERERTLVLPRQDKIEVGRQYRFYFKASAHKSPAQVQTGSSFIDESLPTDGFLGLEAASDYSNIDTVR